MKTKAELNEDVEKLMKYLKHDLKLSPVEAKIVIRRAYTIALGDVAAQDVTKKLSKEAPAPKPAA